MTFSLVGIFDDVKADTNSKSQSNIQGKNNNTKSHYVLLSAGSKNNTSHEFLPHQAIPLNGTVIDSTKMPASNEMIIIEATQNDKPIHRTLVTTNSLGMFSDSSLVVQEQGDVKITARVTNSTSQANDPLITISVKSSWSLPAVIILIAGAFALVLFGSIKEEKMVIVGVVFIVAVGYVIIYTYSPLDSTGNAALATAFLAPIATYAVDFLKTEAKKNQDLEDTVGKYRKDNLTTEVTNSVSIYDEICAHESIFQSKIDDPSLKLSTTNFDKTPKVGTMANLPGLWINKYYHNVNTYNELLAAKTNPKQFTDDTKRKQFEEAFQKVKDLYSGLNGTLYVNMIYNISEIQQRYLSFPTVKIPIRISTPLLKKLQQAGILKLKEDGRTVENPKDLDHIYEEENADKLMKIIGDEFRVSYQNLEDAIKDALLKMN